MHKAHALKSMLEAFHTYFDDSTYIRTRNIFSPLVYNTKGLDQRGKNYFPTTITELCSFSDDFRHE